MMEHEDTSNRIAKVEVLVEGLAKDLSSLASTVERYVGTSGKTNWALVMGGVAALGSFIWLYVGPVSTAANNNHEALVALQKQQIVEVHERGILETEIKWMKSILLIPELGD